MNMQGMKGVNALSKGMEEIKRKQGSSEKEAKNVEVALNTVVCDEAKLSAQAKLEQVWEGLDSENKIRGRFKKFEITADGKYKIETKKGSETISDPSSKTSASTFKKMGKCYEVGAEWKSGADKLNVTKVAVNGKTVEDGNFSYIDGNTLYVYEGIGSNGDKDYSKAGLNKMDVSYFTSADGNIVKDTEHYNKLLGRSKELENLMKIVPMNDKERNKKIVKLEEKINDSGAFFRRLSLSISDFPTLARLKNEAFDLELKETRVREFLQYKNCKPKPHEYSYDTHCTWDELVKKLSGEYSGRMPNQDDLNEISERREKNESKRDAEENNIIKLSDIEQPIDKEALKNITDEVFSCLLSKWRGYGNTYMASQANDIAELRTILKYDGPDEMKAVKHEYDSMTKEMEAMRSEVDYQNKVKNAVKENLLPGIVVE